jgi:hypothetical protein
MGKGKVERDLGLYMLVYRDEVVLGLGRIFRRGLYLSEVSSLML